MMKSERTIRAAGYFRVSSEEQVENWSLDAQERAFGDFCKSKGWDATVRFREEGKSAWTEKLTKRPKFRQLLDDARDRKFDVIVVHSLDRWSRNLGVTLESFRILSQSGVMFVSIQEQIDYTTPEGRLFLVMIGAFAQYFSDSLARHTTKGLKERALRGLYNGEPPFGYERCDTTCLGQPGHLSCHPREVEGNAAKELFRRYAGGGWSTSKLAAWLNDQGLRTKNTKTIPLADGRTLEGPQPFTGYSVRAILHNSFYTGKIKYHEEVYPGLHQALVDEGLFGQVQEALTRARSRMHTVSTARRDYLLQALARCVHCGYPMWADTRGRNQTAYYRERPGLSGSKCQFGAWSIPALDADDQVEQVFAGLALREDWKRRVMERLSSESDRARVAREKAALEARLRRLTEMYIEGNIPKESYQERHRAAKERLDSLVIPEVDAALLAGTMLGDLRSVWEGATVKQRNRLLSSMVDAVLLDPESRSVVGLVPRPAFREVFLSMERKSGVSIFDPAGFQKADPASFVEPQNPPHLVGYGGDGGELNPPSERRPPRTSYKLIRQFV